MDGESKSGMGRLVVYVKILLADVPVYVFDAEFGIAGDSGV